MGPFPSILRKRTGRWFSFSWKVRLGGRCIGGHPGPRVADRLRAPCTLLLPGLQAALWAVITRYLCGTRASGCHFRGAQQASRRALFFLHPCPGQRVPQAPVGSPCCGWRRAAVERPGPPTAAQGPARGLGTASICECAGGHSHGPPHASATRDDGLPSAWATSRDRSRPRLLYSWHLLPSPPPLDSLLLP